MDNNIFYIFDETAKHERFFAGYQNKKNKILLCPITIDHEKIYSVLQTPQSVSNVETTIIPFVHLFNEKAFSIRDEYIKFIYDFGELKVHRKKNLKEYFKSLSGDFSTWWFSLIAEKNTLKTNSFHNFVKLLTILDLQKKHNCRKVFVDIENPELTCALIDNIGRKNCINLNKQTRSELLYIFLVIARMVKGTLSRFRNVLLSKIIMAGLNSRKRILQKSKYLIVTYFPLIDKKALQKGKFINKYYEPLQNALEEKYKGEFSWLAMIVQNEDFSYKDSMLLGRKVNKCGDSLFFCEEWLNLLDFFIIKFEYLFISIKFLLKRSFIKNQFNFQNVKIWEIFKNDWHTSFLGDVLVKGLLYYTIFNKVFSKLKKNTNIIYLCENHAWEKALNIASRKRKDLKTIGIQHTIVPLSLLNYFNHKEELKDGSYMQKMPKPDFLGCVGEIPYELFKKSGWSEKQLFILGTMRHQYLENCLKNEILWKEKENKIVVALSLTPEESREILLYVYYAFKDSSGYKVIIKGHPFLNIGRLISSLGFEFDKRIFQIVKTPLGKLLPKAKCLIVTESSATLEGIASKCVIIIPKLTSLINMNPLFRISDLPIYVENSKELQKVTEEIMERNECFYSYDKCKNLIKSYFEFLNSDDEFLERMERL